MMQAMRAAALLVLVAAALPGCSGAPFMGVRQDKEDQAHAAEVLRRAAPGARFAASRLVVPPWTRLWVLPGGSTTQQVEDRIGIPFPRADVPVPAGAYLVFDDGERVVSAFTYPDAPAGATGRCLGTPGAPLGPGAALVELRPRGGGAPEASTVPAASRCR